MNIFAQCNEHFRFIGSKLNGLEVLFLNNLSLNWWIDEYMIFCQSRQLSVLIASLICCLLLSMALMALDNIHFSDIISLK